MIKYNLKISLKNIKITFSFRNTKRTESLAVSGNTRERDCGSQSLTFFDQDC